MCIGGGGSKSKKEKKFKNPPPVVTGTQEGVVDAKDTKKATEELKIRRMREEGYTPPSATDTAAAEKLDVTGAGRRGNTLKKKSRFASLGMR